MTDKDPLKAIDVAYTDPDFFSRIFAYQAETHYKPLALQDQDLADCVAREYIDLSTRLEETGLQESCSVRNILITRKLANYLIGEDASILDERLLHVRTALAAHLYPLGPDREHDARRRRHILTVLDLLLNEKSLRQHLMRITAPYNNKIADQIIRDTLQIDAKTTITNTETRRAVLSAWLCMLRQNVGSCFATAPAIIVHEEQPEQFLSDIDELLSTGRLRRTFGGMEYSAPISDTWGAGDLRRPFGLNLTKHDVFPVWHSPGFLAALRSVELVSMDRNEGIKQAEELVRTLLTQWPSEQDYVLTTSEELLRRALLTKLELSDDDIKDYEMRPKPMMVTGLLMAGAPTGGTGKAGRCARFFQELLIASNAFKALTENALLRSWEFTVASFAETKPSFTKWNFYSSLGLDARDAGGIGNKLYEILDQKLQQANAKSHEHQEEYEIQYQQLKYLEGRMQRASTDQELRFLKSEYQSRRNEFHTIEVLRNRAHRKAQRYANLFNVLIDQYLALFPNYFQEVYDADLHEGDVGPYDDRPAGFRLLFKHGRTNTALWTRIHNPSEYVDALSAFFTMTEHDLVASEAVEGIEDNLGEITTAVVSHIKTHEFLESALYRMAAGHKGRLPKDPLNNLELVEKKPWAYTSGGTMNTLVSCYFRNEEAPEETSRWVENEMELLVFLLDQAKRLPDKLADEYLSSPGKALLIHSPTHAFLFKPNRPPFQGATQTKEFTYTWVRDRLVQPAIDFVDSVYLDRDLIYVTVETLENEHVPHDYKAWFREVFYRLPGKLRATELRAYLWDEIRRSPRLRRYGRPLIAPDELDAFLYRHLPLTRGRDIAKRLETIILELPSLSDQHKADAVKKIEQILNQTAQPLAITAQSLRHLCLAILCLTLGPHSTHNLHMEVAQTTQRLGFAMPKPIVFADSNWVTDFFAFVVSPATAQLELWRVNDTGSKGHPMLDWKCWVDGSKRKPDWGIYTNPLQYRC